MLKNPRNTTWMYRNQIRRQCLQKFQRFFLLDFEATCDKNASLSPMEIIEFPCLEVQEVSGTFQVLSEFHSFVKPVVHPILTPFCNSLTGISQDAVENECEFPEVLEAFLEWLRPKYDSPGRDKTTFVTCGTWDLLRMLPEQCQLCNLDVPSELKKFINIKTAYHNATGYYPRSLKDIFRHSGIQKRGHLHRGLDDCYNILSVMRYLGSKGFFFEETDFAENCKTDRMHNELSQDEC